MKNNGLLEQIREKKPIEKNLLNFKPQKKEFIIFCGIDFLDKFNNAINSK